MPARGAILDSRLSSSNGSKAVAAAAMGVKEAVAAAAMGVQEGEEEEPMRVEEAATAAVESCSVPLCLDHLFGQQGTAAGTWQHQQQQQRLY